MKQYNEKKQRSLKEENRYSHVVKAIEKIIQSNGGSEYEPSIKFWDGVGGNSTTFNVSISTLKDFIKVLQKSKEQE